MKRLLAIVFGNCCLSSCGLYAKSRPAVWISLLVIGAFVNTVVAMHREGLFKAEAGQ